MRWDLIGPFLEPINPLLNDPDVSDIVINGGRVFVERHGRMRLIPDAVISERALQVAVRNIARILGSDINEQMPILNARLPDGSRVAAVLSPCSVEGTTLAIRKFHSHRFTLDELIRVGTFPMALLPELRSAVEGSKNILVAGATGAGKTTLLNALASYIPDTDRVIVIEDTAELQISVPNLVRLEARREQPGLPAVTIRDLLRATLRLRPDRIVVGEVRGGEAFDLLQALNTGHAGTLSTIHANSAELALSRFTTCVLQSGIELPYRAIRGNIAEALDLVIHIGRRPGMRFVTEVLRMDRYNPDEDRYQFHVLYRKE